MQTMEGILDIKDIDFPSITRLLNGDEYWYKSGVIHRDGDLPAVECANGNKEWYCNGKRIVQ